MGDMPTIGELMRNVRYAMGLQVPTPADTDVVVGDEGEPTKRLEDTGLYAVMWKQYGDKKWILLKDTLTRFNNYMEGPYEAPTTRAICEREIRYARTMAAYKDKDFAIVRLVGVEYDWAAIDPQRNEIGG